MTNAAGSTGIVDRIDATLAALEERGRELGAVEQVLTDAREDAAHSAARSEAGQSRGPLDGMAFAVKANIDVRSVVTTSGLTTPGRAPAVADATAVHLMREAGAIPVATTTMAPMAIGAVTRHPELGPCRSPRDRDRHAGGSSGGSGAVVGAGLVPLALGSDTMGSVRIPAAYCGTAAWLPTHGSVSVRGMVPLAEPLDNVGVLANDPRLLLQAAAVLRAPDAAEPWWHATGDAFAPIPDAPPVIAGCGWSARADADRRAAAEEVAARLMAWGSTRASSVEFDGIDPAQVRRRGLVLVEAAAAETFASDLDAGYVPESLVGLLEYGRDLPAPRLWRTVRELVAMRRRLRTALAGISCVVLPTTPGSAPHVDADPSDAADLTAWVNIAGLPAVVIPWGEASVQLVGAPGSDLALLQWAVRLHEAG